MSDTEIVLLEIYTRMREALTDKLLKNREEAGWWLSKSLSTYQDRNTVVVGIPHGGVCVASVIARELLLPLEVMPCRKIKHPADKRKSIGSVSQDDIFIHDYSYTIPQDYIYHQVELLRNAIQFENSQYHEGGKVPVSLHYKNVILVDDILDSSDTIIACLRSIKRQKPLKIIVAVPVVRAEAARFVRSEADDIVFLRIESSINSPTDYFREFPDVDRSQVIELLNNSRKMEWLYEHH